MTCFPRAFANGGRQCLDLTPGLTEMAGNVTIENIYVDIVLKLNLDLYMWLKNKKDHYKLHWYIWTVNTIKLFYKTSGPQASVLTWPIASNHHSFMDTGNIAEITYFQSGIYF